MMKLKFKKSLKSILALCIVVTLIVSTFVIAAETPSSDDDNNTITWDFATPQINNDAGNELRYSTLENYIAVGKLQSLEGLVYSSADGSEFVFDSIRYPGLMARVTGYFIAQVAYDSPISIVVDLESDSNDMRPIIQAAPTPSGPWVTVSTTSDIAYEKGSDNKYPKGRFIFSADGIGENNCYIKYTIPSEAQESLHIWTWHRHRLQTITFDRYEEREETVDLVNWDFSPYTSWQQSANLSNIIDTTFFPGLVSSGVNSSNETWILDGGSLHLVGTGRMVIKMADNSSFTAVFADSGSGLRPTVKVGKTPEGPWTTIEPTYTKDASGTWVLSVDGIGEGNCYVQYSVSGTTWSSYWYHKLRSISFEKWKEPVVVDDKINWDFTQYNGQTKNLLSITGTLEGLSNSWCDANGTWLCSNGEGLQAVINGVMVINMADNSPFTAVFNDSGSGLRPTVKVGNTLTGPWTTLEPTYTKDENGYLVLSVDGIGEGNCYVQYIISGTGWGSYWNHKLRTISFEKWVEPELPEVDDSHLPECDTNVVFDRFKNATYWDLRECFKVSSNMFFAGTEGGFFPNTMPYEGGKPFVTMRVGKNSPVVVCYGQKSDKVPKFYVSPNGEDWEEIKSDLTDVNSKGQKRAIFNGIGESNMFFKFEFPQDNNDMVNSMGWIVTLESISYNLAGGVVSADTSGKAIYNFTKYNGQEKNLTTITGELTGLVNSWCDANGTWMCGNGGLQAVISGNLVIATQKNSPLEIVYTKSDDNIKFEVRVSSSVGGPWTILDVEPVNDGSKYTISTDGIGEENSFIQIAITHTNWENYYALKLASVTFNALAEKEEELADGMTKVNFVSSKWNQSFDLTKYPEVIGLNGAFVSDKPGYMRVDIDWSTFKINTDNNSSVDFVMAENSSVVLNITTHGPNLEDRPSFYVSSDKKKWIKITPDKIENMGADIKIGSGDYIIKYTFDSIGKGNIFFRFEFGAKKGDPYTIIGLRDLTFKKNTTYVLPDEPVLDSVIIFDAQKDCAYYDFRACEDVTDNMFFGGKERGVFPCTMTTTGHQPGVIIKVAENSPISVRYRDIGMGKKPIYAVSKDKKTWTIIEYDWSDKDSAGDTVDVINGVGEGNYYFRFEFPQTKEHFEANQGWLLTLQSICFNEYVSIDEPDINTPDTPVEDEKDALDEFLANLKPVSKPITLEKESDDDTMPIIPIIIVASVVVLVGSLVTVLILIKHKRKNK